LTYSSLALTEQGLAPLLCSPPVQLGDNSNACDASKNELEQNTPTSRIDIRVSFGSEDTAKEEHAAGNSKRKPFKHDESPLLNLNPA
jgi:hypothetical protein